MLFANAGLILPDRVVPRGWLRVEGGIIAACGSGKAPSESNPSTIDAAGGWLAPGFIDLHVHGAMGRDFMEAREDAFVEILRHHARGGTTTLAATSVTAAWPEIAAMVATA